MKILWIDVSVAAAGDMILGALIDAGADEVFIREQLNKLSLPDWTLKTITVTRQGFRALHAQITVGGAHESGGPGSEPHNHHHGEHHPYPAIVATIKNARLSEETEKMALAVFQRLAQAEAKVHGHPLEQVILHEVGATDAIIDIVGVSAAIASLGVSQIIATPLPMAGGHTQAAHGRIPLPAPATLELVKGYPVTPAVSKGEWVTPTGAAIVTEIATHGIFPAMTIASTGVGAGNKDPDVAANLVRVAVGVQSQHDENSVIELSANIDDMTGELLAHLPKILLDAGALDAWLTPIIMKKGRPGTLVSALATTSTKEAVVDALLRHSTTLGVRFHTRQRTVLERHTRTVQTPYGPVRMKAVGRDGEVWRASPEHDDIAAIAAAHDIPMITLYALAHRLDRKD
jgi:uncharacterized protein (TIGR00299 family) protein